MQGLTFADESSESGDDPEDLLPSASVAARLSKRLSNELLPQVDGNGGTREDGNNRSKVSPANEQS